MVHAKEPGGAVQRLALATALATLVLIPGALRAQDNHAELVRLADFVATNPNDIFIPVYVATRCGTLYLATAAYTDSARSGYENVGKMFIGAALRVSKDRHLLDNPSEGITTLSVAIMKAYAARMTENETRTGEASKSDEMIASDLNLCRARAAAMSAR